MEVMIDRPVTRLQRVVRWKRKCQNYAELLLKVVSAALQTARFPESSPQTCMSLLPKKGNLSSLKNWPPISLINCNAKPYTRLIDARMLRVSQPLINPLETGLCRNVLSLTTVL